MRCLFVLVLAILFYLFFSLAAKLIGPRTGCQFFENVDFLDQQPPWNPGGSSVVQKIAIASPISVFQEFKRLWYVGS